MPLLLKVTMFGIGIGIGDFHNQVGFFSCFRFTYGYLAPPPAVPPRHESLFDRDPRQPGGKDRYALRCFPPEHRVEQLSVHLEHVENKASTDKIE